MQTRFRCETAYGSGIRDIVRVLQYEIFELQNTDILVYIRDHYRETFDDGALDALNEVIFAINEDWTGIDSIEATRITGDIVDTLSEYFGCKLKYALWLADKETVLKFYNAEEQSIDEYAVSEYILCDLGYQGTLYAYTEMPSPVANDRTNVFT